LREQGQAGILPDVGRWDTLATNNPTKLIQETHRWEIRTERGCARMPARNPRPTPDRDWGGCFAINGFFRSWNCIQSLRVHGESSAPIPAALI
jgi:hypothetical protein